MHKDGRRERDEAAGEEPVECANDDDRREAVRSDQAERKDTGDHRAGNDHVERACAVCDEVWNDSTEDGTSVQDREEVETHVVAGNVGFDGVRLHVEENNVQTHESKECSKDEKGVLWFLEGRKVEELAARVRDRTNTQDQVRNTQAEECNEADHTCSPGEADGRLKTVEDDWVDYTTKGRSRSRESHGCCDLGAEVCRQNGNARDEQTSAPDANADRLSKNDLIIA